MTSAARLAQRRLGVHRRKDGARIQRPLLDTKIAAGDLPDDRVAASPARALHQDGRRATPVGAAFARTPAQRCSQVEAGPPEIAAAVC